MTIPSYIQGLRRKIGHDRLLIPSVAAIIHDDVGRLLLQRKAGSEGWSLPAGAIELGEPPEAALNREVFEETGFKVISASLTGAFGGNEFRYTYPNGDRVEYTVLLYRCRVEFPATKPVDPETVELRYFGINDAPSLALPYPQSALFG
ncbi:NUDIX domain-containing protein [Phaeobacter gallaeciensis]|uniref:ADP-ribose pyrophosphatase n=1 Tax=Phaeobacter gallaeciensis TaxID=60890 RepID=A0AAD0ECM5_9RHOB|nr:NUDIX domain-containing protein [Phaeobacter gallaeciensis]AHD09381.1 ADP-ribose pyrophosphatase [Phaeobacter gallaeciensis DSM 26640]ATE92644.1 ADP-ribose pyrophosphatase [Phaeobacter gallaeciensis]ATE97534.1 ADP-ribose pyrophosphatase [Phaeobacter gallaeciensis]ATF01309.1 ADP-ribose pyrophosphatase [Phaeobacter gallaeciensis]ATF05689.1 ADP-ribose pyrophosphatase [Phaeobacter gallaeciensis]